MSKLDGLAFGGAGLAAWSAATLFYAAFGGGLLESAFWFYAINAFAAAAAATFTFQAVARLTHTPRRRRLFAMILFSTPGLVAGGLVVSRYAEVMPAGDPVSVGRYGAFLVVLYVAVAASVFERAPHKA
ncbi:hypothetical protein [Caulobacter sp. FWC2]|uniref:hypothetical protein n=1 Tax=Caulobacter sp. FWC2 TaxID=69664 RepID=UPI000C1540FF|nr:hypothetical protein [Caulobacter sp. FWC2]PIB93178.1 hypothetical protein CSW62_17275 [Caulobacter sp. FWC2]